MKVFGWKKSGDVRCSFVVVTIRFLGCLQMLLFERASRSPSYTSRRLYRTLSPYVRRLYVVLHSIRR